MNMDTNWWIEWITKIASEEEKRLVEKIEDFEEYFKDMLFEPDSIITDLTKCQFKEKEQWVDSTIIRPEELEYFSINMFHYKVEETKESIGGFFDEKAQLLCISRKYIDDDATILHEMIHLHEFVINKLPMFYHDTLYWGLYIYLREIIPELDKIITDHAHILTEYDIYSRGGVHDILFLLKSLELDVRRAYPLGTVFSYGRENDFKSYRYK